MRKVVTFMALAAAMLPPLVSPAASAHADWQIAGYQYVAASFEGVSHGGYVSTGPTGPIQITEGHVDDGIGSITNRDPINHTFTHCTANCETSDPSWEDALFDVSVPAGQGARPEDIQALNGIFEGNAGVWMIVCRVHPALMRARVTTTGV